MNSKTILIIHFHSSRNAGDAAQLDAAIQDLRTHFDQPRIVVAANYPDEEFLNSLPIEVVPSVASLAGISRSLLIRMMRFVETLIRIFLYYIIPKMLKIRFLGSRRWRSTLSAYEEADLVISTPGNIFFSMGTFGYPFLLSALSVLPALFLEKPFYVLPQTVGPLSRWWERFILKQLYQPAKMIFLREPQSLKFVRLLGMPESITALSPDPSLGPLISRPNAPPSKLVKAGFTPNSKALGVTTIPRIIKNIHPKQLENYYRVLAQSISNFANRYHLNIIFFPQVTGPMPNEDDRHAIQKIVRMLSCPAEQITVVDEPLSPSELKACYAWMDIFIATRLHSAVFSLTCAVPTILIGYLPKTKAYAELLNYQTYYLELSELHEKTLSLMLTLLWEERDQISAEIKSQIRELTNKRATAAQLIAQDFKNDE